MQTVRNRKTRRVFFSGPWRGRVIPFAVLLAGASALYGTAGCGGTGNCGCNKDLQPSPSPSISPTAAPTTSPSGTPAPSPSTSPITSPTAAPSPSPSVVPAAVGVARVRLDGITPQVRSVRLTLARTTDYQQTNLLLPIDGRTTSRYDVDVPDLAVYDYDVYAMGYAMDDGTGTTLASAQSAVRIRRDRIAEVAIRLVPADTDITVTAAPGYRGNVGTVFTLTAVSSTLPLLAAQTTWENRTPSVVQLSAGSGTQVTATALAGGTAVLVVRDAVSGKTSAPLTLTIDAPQPPTGDGNVIIK